jgi:hypothetical protein
LPVRLDDPRGGRRSGGSRHGSGTQQNTVRDARQPWHAGDARYVEDSSDARSRPDEARRKRDARLLETRPQKVVPSELASERSKSGGSALDRPLLDRPELDRLPRKIPDGRSARRAARSARSGRSGRRRIHVVHVVTAASAAIVLAAAGTTAWYRIGPGAPNGSGAAAAFNALPNSKALSGLEAERQQIVDMNAATHVMTSISKPLTASVPQDSSGGSSSTSGGVGVVTAPDPAEAETIAQELMPSYGFSVSGQWSCLYDIWNRESGWMYDAENVASGAYGIPQSLPGYKMAMFGADWQTDATTQIKWGLWYIQNRYGTPCAAWDFELANGYY